MTVIIVADGCEVRAYDGGQGEDPHPVASVELYPGDGRMGMCSRRRGSRWDVEVWCCDMLIRAATICDVSEVCLLPGSPPAEWAPGEGPRVIVEGGTQ